MERRLNNKLESYIITFKDNIKEKASQIGIMDDSKINELFQYIYE